MSEFMIFVYQILVLNRVARIQQLLLFNDGFRQALLPQFLLRIKFLRILGTILCLETLLWLFSPALDAVKLTLKVGSICPLVVIDPTNLPGLMLVHLQSIPEQNTCLFLLVCLSVLNPTAYKLIF